MQEFEKVLVYLRDNKGSALRSVISIEVFQRNLSASELDELLNSPLSGLVQVESIKTAKTSASVWKLTSLGWEKAHGVDRPAQELTPAQAEAIPEGFARFRQLARQNPDCSPQRLLQLAGRHLGDPLESDWAEWRESHQEWFLKQPRDWYAKDVELDADGYPLRYPSDPLTLGEHEDRPKTERGWSEWATRQPGARLEPLAKEMPAYQAANVIRVCRKVGLANAIDIFGQAKIDLAHRLTGVTVG
jgi:hypothetical protein